MARSGWPFLTDFFSLFSPAGLAASPTSRLFSSPGPGRFVVPTKRSDRRYFSTLPESLELQTRPFRPTVAAIVLFPSDMRWTGLHEEGCQLGSQQDAL